MADQNKMDRTWLCSVLFMDIANYSSQSVGLQMKWKQRFNDYLRAAIKDVPEGDRVILDTGDGAAVCFLGAPEAAMFAALELCRSFAVDEREHSPGLQVRLGINLGPVKLVKDINGALNAIGDGINAGQRIMSFAPNNQILVSQSFYEVVSRLDDDYKLLFHLKGIETDKHVREHTVYSLTPPGSEDREPTVANADGQTIMSKPRLAATPAAAAAPIATKTRMVPWAIAGVAVAGLAAVGLWQFSGGSHAAAPAPPAAVTAPPVAAATAPSGTTVQTSSTNPVSPAPTTPPSIAPKADAAPDPPATASAQPAPAPGRALRGEIKAERKGLGGTASSPAVSPRANAAYNQGMTMMDANNSTEAMKHFDDAIRMQPDYLDAYLARAEIHRRLAEFDASLPDCQKAIQLSPNDARGYNCRGFGHQLLKQLQVALPDYDKAISLNPNLVLAYEHRGTTYDLLQQYDKALLDYSQAIRLTPRNALFLARRGEAYINLKQYDKAINDLSEAIRLQPNDKNAYRLRALAEQASGNKAAAAADREKMKEAPMPRKKIKE
jgi:Tfp pilus assembly protein PilF/class 3 adenylate cyclase